MKKIIIGLIVSISLLAFSGIFTETVNLVIDIAKKCQEDMVFTEELYNISTGKTWGIATYIPVDDNIKINTIFTGTEGVKGFLVIKLLEDLTSGLLITGEVKLTGKGGYSEDIKEVYANLLMLTDNHFVTIYQGWDEFLIVTDREYIILYVLHTSLLNNYDYIVNLKTETATATWKIRRNSLEYKKIINIFNEKKTE